MLNPSHDSYDGVILGLSNVEVGVIPSQFKAAFCNLAVSSQDIYYNLKTLEYCYENYYEKLKNLKYAIVDLHDYNYFNFDTSLSNSAVKYLFLPNIVSTYPFSFANCFLSSIYLPTI